ncbi:MAG: TauD/TfdA family dioxygenase [Pseudomonadota bacterium]
MAEPELSNWTSEYNFESIIYDDRKRQLYVRWADGHTSAFPYIWLRHAMYFPALGRPEQAHNGDYLLPEEPASLSVSSIVADQGVLTVVWAHDDSRTRHSLSFLRDNCLSEQARRTRQPRPVPWLREDAEEFEWFDASALAEPTPRLEIFCRVRDRGLALVRDVEAVPGTVMEIAKYFGPVRRTHHGSLFDIRSLPADRQGVRANIGATASNTLAPHTDEGFRHAALGIMLFHCLKPDPSGGGVSTFVDGIAAAEDLRVNNPEAFAFLRSTPMVLAAERNKLERFRTRCKLIATDSSGVVRGVRMADRTLPPVDLPIDQVEDAYRALRAFSSELYAPHRVFEHLFQPGEMAIFDNQRVLHSRKAFNREAGERHIQQVSIERDEFHNLFRQLAEQVGRFDLANWEPDAGALCQD